jgi:hypothetical protein
MHGVGDVGGHSAFGEYNHCQVRVAVEQNSGKTVLKGVAQWQRDYYDVRRMFRVRDSCFAGARRNPHKIAALFKEACDQLTLVGDVINDEN